LCVYDDDGDALGRVAGCFEYAQDDFADVKLVAVAHDTVGKARVGTLAEDYLRAGARGEFAVTAHEVRVKVRLDDVLYLEPLRRGFRDVLVNVALRVNDRGLASLADEV